MHRDNVVERPNYLRVIRFEKSLRHLVFQCYNCSNTKYQVKFMAISWRFLQLIMIINYNNRVLGETSIIIIIKLLLLIIIAYLE